MDLAGQDIMFVPGLLCTGDLFAAQIAHLSNKHRCHVADHAPVHDRHRFALLVLKRHAVHDEHHRARSAGLVVDVRDLGRRGEHVADMDRGDRPHRLATIDPAAVAERRKPLGQGPSGNQVGGEPRVGLELRVGRVGEAGIGLAARVGPRPQSMTSPQTH